MKAVYTAAALDVSYDTGHGITHRKINALDAPEYNMSQHFSNAYGFLVESLAKGNVLVHCAAGVSRSATIVIMYLMKSLGWQFDKAIKFVRDKRGVICPNPGFRQQLMRFQKTIKPDIDLKKQQSAVLNFLNQESGRKTSNSMAKSTVTQSKNSTMRTFSTTKREIKDPLSQSKTQQFKSGGSGSMMLTGNSRNKPYDRLERFQALVGQPLFMEKLKEPKIVSHKS